MGQPFNIKDFGTLTSSRHVLALLSSCPEPVTSVEFLWSWQNATQYNILPYWCVLTRTMHVVSPWQQHDCNDSQIFLRKISESERLRLINITLISECKIKLLVSWWFKATFENIYYTHQFNPKTEDSSSNKRLICSLDTNLILYETGLDLTLKKWFLICKTLLYATCFPTILTFLECDSLKITQQVLLQKLEESGSWILYQVWKLVRNK